MVNLDITICILYFTCRTEPRIDSPVIFPIPVVNQQYAVTVRFVITEIMVLIELFRINSHKFVIIDIRLNLSGIFFQRLVQSNQYDIAARLLLPLCNQLTQLVFFLVRQNVPIVEYAFISSAFLIRSLIICHLRDNPMPTRQQTIDAYHGT